MSLCRLDLNSGNTSAGDLYSCNCIKKTPQDRCFPVNFQFFQNTFLTEDLWTSSPEKKQSWARKTFKLYGVIQTHPRCRVKILQKLRSLVHVVKYYKTKNKRWFYTWRNVSGMLRQWKLFFLDLRCCIGFHHSYKLNSVDA